MINLLGSEFLIGYLHTISEKDTKHTHYADSS